MFLLAVLRSILGVDPALNVVKYKKGSSVRFHTTNQQKHCDYVIDVESMSMKQKICRVEDLPTSLFS